MLLTRRLQARRAARPRGSAWGSPSRLPGPLRVIHCLLHCDNESCCDDAAAITSVTAGAPVRTREPPVTSLKPVAPGAGGRKGLGASLSRPERGRPRPHGAGGHPAGRRGACPRPPSRLVAGSTPVDYLPGPQSTPPNRRAAADSRTCRGLGFPLQPRDLVALREPACGVGTVCLPGDDSKS